MKLALGTVQFGMDYGAFNTSGRVPEGEVVKILKTARESGINLLDTAQAYGDSEKVLGRSHLARYFNVVSKVPAINSLTESAQIERDVVGVGEKSLRDLGVGQLYGLMLHRGQDLLEKDGPLLWKSLEQLKARGLVRKVGISVYDVEEAQSILDRYPVELIQLPMNVLDQRFLVSGMIKTLKMSGVEVHVRSAFLQGLLLADPNTLASKFDSVRKHLIEYQRYISELGITPAQAALGFLLRQESVDKVVVGVLSELQLHQIIDACKSSVGELDLSRFAWNETKIINPSKWNT